MDAKAKMAEQVKMCMNEIRWRNGRLPKLKRELRSGAKDYASLYASYVPREDYTIADQYVFPSF